MGGITITGGAPLLEKMRAEFDTCGHVRRRKQSKTRGKKTMCTRVEIHRSPGADRKG